LLVLICWLGYWFAGADLLVLCYGLMLESELLVHFFYFENTNPKFVLYFDSAAPYCGLLFN
jgi:hypothetical protein